MHRISCLILTLMFLGGFFLSAPGAADAALIEVKVHQGLVDVRALEVPLGEVLKALCDKAEIQLEGDTALQENVSVGLESEDIDKVFSRLLRNHSYVLLYERVGEKGMRPKVLRIVRGGIPGSGGQGVSQAQGTQAPRGFVSRDAGGRVQQTVGPRERSTPASPGRNVIEVSGGTSGTEPVRRVDAGTFGQVLSGGQNLLSQLATGPTAAKSPDGGGMLLAGVTEGSVFSQLGLEPGDIVTNVNGNPVLTINDLVKALEAATKDLERPVVRIERIRKDGTMDPIYLELNR